MPATRLDDLPCEILELIASNLDGRSLLSFNALNKKCHSAAGPTLYRSVRFQIDERCHLQDEVANLVEALRGLDAFKHVRSLEISGEWRTGEVQRNRYPERGCHPWTTNHDTAKFRGSRSWRRRCNADFTPASKTCEDDALWQPFADLLDKLHGLRDLVYDCPHQFSPCLLETLHTRLPTCRLHIRCFRFRSLLDDDRLDGHESRLATSPNLSSLFTSLGTIKGDRCGDPSYKSIVKVASCLAPNLKEVRIDSVDRGPSTPRRIKCIEITCSSGRRNIAEKISMKGAVQVLELVGNMSGRVPIDKACLKSWNTAIDLARLARLHLGSVGESALQWAVERKPFRNLTSLKILIISKSQALHDKLGAFLESLPPLHDFEAIGFFFKDDMTALITQQQMSGSLRRLYVEHPMKKASSSFSANQIVRLHRACPRIEFLRVTMELSINSSEEAERYRALGSFSRDDAWFLTLDRQKLEAVSDLLVDDADGTHASQMYASIEPWLT